MLLWIFCGACITVLAALHRWSAKGLNNQKGLEMHPQTYPLIGILPLMLKAMKEGTVTDVILDEHKRNGWKAYAHSVPGRGMTVQIVDPADIKHVSLTAGHKMVAGPFVRDPFHELFGYNIIVAEGEDWKEQRRTFNHILTKRMLRDRMSDVFGKTAQTAVTVLKEKLAAGDGRVDAFDMQRFLRCLAFDATNSVAFSRGTKALIGNPKDVALQDGFDRILIRIFDRFLTPWWKVNRMFQLSESERDFRRSLAACDKHFDSVFDDFVNKDGTMNEDRIRDGTMSSIFVEHLHDIEDGTAVTKVPMRERLRELITTTLIAGRDTISSAMTSTLYLLCQKENAHWMEKLRAEALKIFGNELNRPLTYDDLDGAPVMHAVFMEATRLMPPAPVNERVATEDITFPSGFEVKAGQAVGWSPWAINRNPKLWGEDVEVFRPERWMDGKKYDDYMYNSFGSGHRSCVGKPMALIEAKITLLTLFAHFRFERNENFTGRLELGFVSSLNDGRFLNVMSEETYARRAA